MRHDDRQPVDRQDDGPGPGRRLLRWVSAILLLGLMIGGGHELSRLEPSLLPIRVVTVDGELLRLSPEQLQETVTRNLGGGIVTQDLAKLKEAVEAMSWVRSASLRRIWPDRLELKVVEHRPLARWGEDGLVSFEGVVFRPPAAERPEGLPVFHAGDHQAPDLVRRYQDWQIRFADQGIAVEVLRLDARGAWSIRVDEGFELSLGRLRVEERVMRFLGSWRSLSAVGVPAKVDMRYSNGLAIIWREHADEASDDEAAGGAQASIGHGPQRIDRRAMRRGPAVDGGGATGLRRGLPAASMQRPEGAAAASLYSRRSTVSGPLGVELNV
jgi:cell division protein FtsQ